MLGFDDAIAAGLDILKRYIPDPEQRAKAAAELEKEITARRVAQIQLNTAETMNGSWLGKWRGFLGWGCACSAIYQLILQPFMVFFILIFQPNFPVEKMPKLEWQQLGQLLMGMLGLS